jgi:hypothetical protein
MAPVDAWHCVVQVLDCWFLHSVKLLSWHCSWQVASAVAVHAPLQSALHLVVQSAVVDTGTHWVLHLSSQQAPHEAWQSVDDSDETEPSGEVEDEDDDVQEALHPAEQRWTQSVVQSKVGGLLAHDVEQSDWQLEVQLVSADAIHCPSHCCSSCAAHACSQLAGAHWVEQLFWTTREHCAFASTSMLPHALITTSARAIRGSAKSAAQAMGGNA